MSTATKNPLVFSTSLRLSNLPRSRYVGHASCRLSEKNGQPIIVPLDTLDQVLSWEPCSDSVCVPSIGLQSRPPGEGGSLMDDPAARKTLVCHDMMGGYILDKFIQGTSDLQDYYFYQWQFIDVFVYFSHHFITLPPPTWTNAAHKNGVLSMGTIITEWADGAKLCQRLLSDDWTVTQFCDKLITMATFYKLDGWLVNIENPIPPMLIDRLYMFLSLLTTGMHAACPGSKVIWYDSVTTDGNLKWQNALNHLNKPYFDLCDGIFLNYNWTEAGLAGSCDLAGGRKGEVYVGVDVFGRGCFGGGGFNTCKAVEVITRQNLSSAIFAPGWVYETQSKAHFFSNQERFWSMLSPWIECRCVPSLPMVSAFGRGYGQSVSIDGKMVHQGAWSYHSAQDVQLSRAILSTLVTATHSSVRIEGMALDTSTVYNNGASVRMVGSVGHMTTGGISRPALVKLFKTQFRVTSPLLVGLTYSCDHAPSAPIRVYLQLHTDSSSRIFLDLLTDPVDGGAGPISVSELPTSTRLSHLPGCVLAPLPSAHSTAIHRAFTGEGDSPLPWRTRYYVVTPPDAKGLLIQDTSLGVYWVGKVPVPHGNQPQPFTLTLGEIKIMPTSLLSARYEVVNIWAHSYQLSVDQTSLSLTLGWLASWDETDPIEHYNIYSTTRITGGNVLPWRSQYIYRGRAYANSYRVTDVYLLRGADPKDAVSVSLIVQPVTRTQRKPALGACPRLTLTLAS